MDYTKFTKRAVNAPWEYVERAMDALRAKNRSYTETQKQTFDELLGTLDDSHNGVYVIQIDIDSAKYPLLFWLYKTFLTFDFPKKEDQLLAKYRGKTLRDVTTDSLTLHSHGADGAIVLDKELRVVDDHRVIKRIRKHLISDDARSGTGHAALATLSLWPGVTTYAAGNEYKTVKTFRLGGPIRELCYDPNSPIPYNHETFSEKMLGYLNATETHGATHQRQVSALMGAFALLKGANLSWETMSDKERGVAIYYWSTCIQPLAEKLGIDLDPKGKASGKDVYRSK